MSTGRAMLIGAIFAVAMVVGVAAVVVTGGLGTGRAAGNAVEGPVVVALVMPNESGVQEPRVLDVYTHTASGWSLSSVSPSLPVVVSGTTGKTLADAYVFGGGAALAKAYSSLGRGPAASWVVVDSATWSMIASATPLYVDLTSPLEVFDGSRLISFPAGRGSVPATQTGQLLIGAQYLRAGEDATVRARVGDALGEALAGPYAAGQAGLMSDLRRARLNEWLGSLGSRVRGSGD